MCTYQKAQDTRIFMPSIFVKYISMKIPKHAPVYWKQFRLDFLKVLLWLGINLEEFIQYSYVVD